MPSNRSRGRQSTGKADLTTTVPHESALFEQKVGDPHSDQQGRVSGAKLELQAITTAVIALADEPTTRTGLAAKVNEMFQFSIQGLWIWLEEHGKTPPGLPGNWDPIQGVGGAYAHFCEPGHAFPSLPTITVPKQSRVFANDGLAVTDKMRRKTACRVCGISSVLWRCWLATQPRGLKYIERYQATLAEIGKIVADARKLYRKATTRFATSHRAKLRKLGQKQSELFGRAKWADERKYSDAKEKLRDLYENDGLLREGLAPIRTLCIDKYMFAGLRDVEARLNILRHFTVGLARNDLGRPQRWSGSGRRADFINVIWKTLWDHGFSYREVGDLARPNRFSGTLKEVVRDRINPRCRSPKQSETVADKSGESASAAPDMEGGDTAEGR